MVRVAQQDQDSLHQNEEEEEEGEENVGQNTGNHGGVTIRDIGEERSSDYGSNSLGVSSLENGASSTDAICVRRDSETLQRLDSEDVSHASSTQYSDVDDSLEGSDELGSWSNDLNLPVSLQQSFDNGVSLPISEVPSFGDVCVKNSANVHFGNKTFYNGPVTIKQIVYANPNLSEEGTSSYDDTGDGTDNKPRENGTSVFPEDGYPASGRTEKTANSENARDDFKVTQWCAWLLTWRCVALMCAMGSCLVASVVVSVVLLSRDSSGVPSGAIFPQIPSGSPNVPTKLRFVERAEWGAQPPTEAVTKLKLPVPYVIISHTVTDFCKTQSECTFRVRFAQTFHIESRGWSDIAYNFLVGGDGYAYVGRGWDNVGAHSYNYNARSIGISFIGTFNTVVPPKEQLFAAQELIRIGVKMGKIAPDYMLIAHRQVSSTLSPGDALYSIMRTWPHWTNISSIVN